MNQKPRSPEFSPGVKSPPVSAKPRHVATGYAIDDAMRIDRFRLSKLRKRLSGEEFAKQLAESVDRCNARKRATPRIEYPCELPITSHRDELLALLKEHQVIIVCGETGSGKSTQLPKVLLEAGFGRDAMIGHTQPRRLAARSIAARLAEELACGIGKTVGFQIRFGDQTGPETLIKLMTDGILLAETQSDRFLDAYDAIIIDEAHERSLNIDFLLGYLRRLQSKRSDFKLIITSATIDAKRFAEHFASETGPAPIVNVEGRGYPVEMRYLPWEDLSDDEGRDGDLAQHVIAGLESLSRSRAGDTLVFLPTERDIREVTHQVAGHYKRLGLSGRVDLLPLYARLPTKEQQRIFHPDQGKRRIIFATNVAESSLTVPGIHSVIDSGTARISRYSPRSKVQRLPIEPVSRASADQRAGRCGRIGPGICVRLYSADDYDSRDAFTTPEIRRTNLASVILKTKTLRLGRLEDFPLIDPPRPESIREGLRTLRELSAIDERHELTAIGHQLGRLPVDPRVGRMILAAQEHGVLAEVLPIAAALEIQDPRDRPQDKQQAADQAHASFADPNSDFLSYLALWRYYEQARSEHSRSKLTRVLRQQFLSPNRMREWSDVYRQLKEMAATSLADPKAKQRKSGRKKIGAIRYSDDPSQLVDENRSDAIHQALLTGLLSSVAMAKDKKEYTGAGGLSLVLWPGSGVFANPPKWIVAAELVETTRQYARTVARIQPQWIEAIGSHLIKRSHSDPHWSAKTSGAYCFQRVSLFGLPVVARRRVPLSPIDPATARELLIEHGLVQQQMRTTARFLRHNRDLEASLASLAAKTRRRDLVVDPYLIERFYQSQLPEQVYDRASLEKYDRTLEVPAWSKRLRDAADLSAWLQSPPQLDDAATCYMKPGDLIEAASETITKEAFPDELEIGSSRLPLSYRFEPGSAQDGIHLRIHEAAISQVSDDRLGWLVPGLLETKLIAMIKSLPKRIRRNLVPAAEVAARIGDELRADFGKVPFMPSVCAAMSRHAEMPVTQNDFQPEKLDDYLQFLVTVVNDEGKTIASGREVEPLKEKLGSRSLEPTTTESENIDESWARESMTTFDIDQLPREVVRNRGGVKVAQYPAIVDLGDKVTIRLLADEASAESASRQGTMRLFSMLQRKELRGQVRWLPSLEQVKIKLNGVISASAMERQLIDLLARIAFVENEAVVRSQADFETRQSERGRRIAEATQEIAGWLPAMADAYFSARREIESLGSNRFDDVRADVTQQVEWLTAEGFLSNTPWTWLKHYPRYFSAIAYRLDKVRSGAATRDREAMDTLAALHRKWTQSLRESQRDPLQQATTEVRWMMEELRVSLFAQPLGTSVKVSAQRCEKMLS
ncbi:ATP-dependent RNA helicase HrpA [Novipirellula artificiosorum]|uniref:ATP-dependent RNA helicase HrpB n=1 Tax=Novipirellula artificiosorum TaxID=2528016 RepID=A0A5C6DWK0_9BACT|nr:ATP-dependent RNA helicase HrpA [Novipirellula artificiosorum]TWU40745.1 ATP-dependent RNA helicase HrpB [Novipirellula artificiosorum]